MCCLKIDTETLLANCLNTCKTYSFSLDDLRQADEDRIALRSEWQHDDKKLPMAYFDFGYSAADIRQLCAAAEKHCTTQNEQLPSCANRVE